MTETWLIAPLLGVPIYDLDGMPNADIGLSVRFHQLLRERHLARFAAGVVNLHGAPLPELRGSMCDTLAIIEGHTEFGASLHWMNTGIDSGPVLCVNRFPIRPRETGYSLFSRTNASGLALIKQNLAAIVSGEIEGVAQAGGREIRRAQVMAMKQIDASLSGMEIDRRGRAFTFPGTKPLQIARRAA